MGDLHRKSAFELAHLIRKREVKPSEALADSLARVEALNPRLNAFCALRAGQAMDDARALDEKIARRESLGPLAGVPFGVKDLEDVTGMATTFGSVPFKNNIATRDAIQVGRLRAAGAIVIGKTNTPEFGSKAFTRNLLFGVTRSPWNPELTPGGSSGGSSAAVAAAMVPLATASDMGGSIRLPAAFTGCVGLKPSHGRIPAGPRLGMPGFNDLAVVGPISRTVRDAALYMDAVVGYDPLDADSLPHPGISYLTFLDRGPRRLRIAFHPDFGRPVQRDIMREVAAAADVFRALGHEVVTLEEAVPDTRDGWASMVAAQSLASLGEYVEHHRGEFGRAFVSGLEAAARITWQDYGTAQRVRARFNEWVAGIFRRYDLLLSPTMPIEAFPAEGPPPLEIEGVRIADYMDTLPFTYPFNLSGHPAISVPAGFTDRGLPCGIQIVAERHRDDLVLAAAYAFEVARPWNDKWPIP